MDPAKKLGNSLGTKTKSLLAKLGFGDKTLKVLLLAIFIAFGISLFLFKFELLSVLSNDEANRLNSVLHLKTFVKNPTDPIQGTLQWLSLKAFPSHHIFALRFPTAIMLGGILALASTILYLKFRNRYLPYIFAILAVTSPWMILISHQGYVPGIDLLFLDMTVLCSYFLITKSDASEKIKTIALITAATAIGLVALQPFGPAYYLLALLIAAKSPTLKDFISKKSKKLKFLLIVILVTIPSIIVGFLYANLQSWKLITGLSLIKNPLEILKALLYNTRSIFGLEQTQGLSLGTGRPDFLLMGALALTVYEIFKQRIGRKGLVIGLCISLLVSALYRAPTSIIFAIPFTIAILSLALANMIRIIDAAFPRNPYPRNIARAGMLMLVCLLTTLNIYTFISATVRENKPQQIDTITINRGF